MEQHENMAPGQQNFPKKDKEENPDTLSGQEILSGAQQQDQLNQFKENADGTKPEDNAGDQSA